MDILLTHGYFLYDDPHERQVMKPYPPLGILYISSYLKSRGFDVGVFDSTLASLEAFSAYVAQHRPPVVGIYTNMMTKFAVLKMIGMCKAHGALVVLGGPEPPYYAADYLARGADIVVKGEGELTLEELLHHLAKQPAGDPGRGRGLGAINGIAYLDDSGALVETFPRAQIADLSAMPWPDRSLHEHLEGASRQEQRQRDSGARLSLHLPLVQSQRFWQHAPPPHARGRRRRGAVDQGAL